MKSTQERKHALPPSIANLTLEDSQKLNVDTLKKLKARDKKIAELTAANEKLTAVQHSTTESSGSAAQNAVTEVLHPHVFLSYSSFFFS